MATLKDGKFDFVVVDKDSFRLGTTNRSSIIAMIENDCTAKVNMWVGETLLKAYTRTHWAVKFMQHIPSKAVLVVLYTKESYNRGK